MLRPKKKKPSLVVKPKKSQVPTGEKSCMKYFYKDHEEYETKNLPCERRPWTGDFEKDYKPKEMNDYVNKYFSNQNFDGESPFAYQPEVREKTSEEVCDRSEFKLAPHQKFAGKWITNDTDFPGMLVYHNLGSGKSCTSIVIGEAMKSMALTPSGEFKELNDRGPFKVLVVAPKNIQEQYYEELIGRVEDNTIQSCPAGCMIMEGDEGPVRQVYVGNMDSRGKYRSRELSQIQDIRDELKELRDSEGTAQGEDKKEIKKKIKILERRLQTDLQSLKNKINVVYYVVSHDTFLNRVMKTIKIGTQYTSEPTDFLLKDQVFHSDRSLIIIDEIQKMVREYSDSTGSNYRRLYYTLMMHARNRDTGKPAMKVVLLTATPVYDNPHEAALMLNLLRPRIPFPLRREKFGELFINKDTQLIKNKLLFQYMCSGYVSYFKGGNPNGYPYRRNYIQLHPMKSYQESVYTETLVAETVVARRTQQRRTEEEEEQASHFTGAVQKANIGYPRDEEFTQWTKRMVMMYRRNKDMQEVLDYVSQYSNKFAHIIDLIYKSPGPVFIYTNWVNHGILALVAILNALEWEFITTNTDRPRYAVWSPSGLERLNTIYRLGKSAIRQQNQEAYIKFMRTVFNSPENWDGKLCKVLIGNVVEGVSLRRVTQVHVCEPWWNESKLEQVVARAIRFCSHADLPADQRYVDVYYHVSTLSTYPSYNPVIESSFVNSGLSPKYRDLSRSSIEQKMYTTAARKNRINIQFELGLKQSAVDCNLNRYGNIIRLEEVHLPGRAFDGVTLYYNRSTNKYYQYTEGVLIGVDLVHTSVIEDLEVYNWPAINYVPNGKNIDSFEDWQIQDDSILVPEDIGCDIDNPVTSDKNFEKLKEFALELGEEEDAWEYCEDMYTKNQMFPNFVTKYGVLNSGRGDNMGNCLYRALLQPTKYRFSVADVKRIEKFLFRPEALIKNTTIYKEKIMYKYNKSRYEVDRYNYAQLETLANQ